MDKKLAKLLLRMHRLYNRRFSQIMERQQETTLEVNKIEDELQSIINGGYSGEKEAILLMVEEREFKQRCLNVNLCPECGMDLGRDQYEEFKICRRCNLSFEDIQ